MRDFPDITATPGVCFGAPRLVGSGVRTRVIASRFLGGDSVEALAKEYEVTRYIIQEAIAFELALNRRLVTAMKIARKGTENDQCSND